MKSQDFFDEQLLSVIDGQGVGWTLRVQVRAGEVRVGVEVGQQVVTHSPEFVAFQERRRELHRREKKLYLK